MLISKRFWSISQWNSKYFGIVQLFVYLSKRFSSISQWNFDYFTIKLSIMAESTKVDITSYQNVFICPQTADINYQNIFKYKHDVNSAVCLHFKTFLLIYVSYYVMIMWIVILHHDLRIYSLFTFQNVSPISQLNWHNGWIHKPRQLYGNKLF